MKTREDKRLVKLVLFSNMPFLGIHSKKSTLSLVDAWSFLFVYIRFTPSEGPKDFVNCFFRLFIYKENRPWKSDHKVGPLKDHLPWSDFMVHGVNRP